MNKFNALMRRIKMPATPLSIEDVNRAINDRISRAETLEEWGNENPEYYSKSIPIMRLIELTANDYPGVKVTTEVVSPEYRPDYERIKICYNGMDLEVNGNHSFQIHRTFLYSDFFDLSQLHITNENKEIVLQDREPKNIIPFSTIWDYIKLCSGVLPDFESKFNKTYAACRDGIRQYHENERLITDITMLKNIRDMMQNYESQSGETVKIATKDARLIAADLNGDLNDLHYHLGVVITRHENRGKGPEIRALDTRADLSLQINTIVNTLSYLQSNSGDDGVSQQKAAGFIAGIQVIVQEIKDKHPAWDQPTLVKRIAAIDANLKAPFERILLMEAPSSTALSANPDGNRMPPAGGYGGGRMEL